LELLPGFRISTIAAFGLPPALVDKLTEGARLAELPIVWQWERRAGHAGGRPSALRTRTAACHPMQKHRGEG
jgi:hypothetical protein